MCFVCPFLSVCLVVLSSVGVHLSSFYPVSLFLCVCFVCVVPLCFFFGIPPWLFKDPFPFLSFSFVDICFLIGGVYFPVFVFCGSVC